MEEFDSRPPRHHVIADHQIGPLRPREEQRLLTILCAQRAVPELLDDIAQYEDVYRLCFMRGPEGIIIGLAERLG